VIATKLGAPPTRAGVSFADRAAADEGLSPAAIQAAARESPTTELGASSEPGR
jgi:hypothetical protein